MSIISTTAPANRRPCPRCGQPAQIRRLGLARFGLSGWACRNCYNKLDRARAKGTRPPAPANVDALSTPPAVPREAAAQLLALRAAQRAEAAASARVAEYRAASERARANRDAARAASVIETWTYEDGRVARRVAGPAMTPAMKGGAPC